MTRRQSHVEKRRTKIGDFVSWIASLFQPISETNPSSKNRVLRKASEVSVDTIMTWFVKQSSRHHVRRNGSTQRQLTREVNVYAILKGKT